MLVFKVKSVIIDIVNKYLRCISNSDLSESFKLESIIKSFMKSKCMFLRKFSTVELLIKLRLFTSLSMSLYGLELKTDTKSCSAISSKLIVLYDYASKKLIGFLKSFSNYYAYNYVDMLVFKQLRNYSMLSFFCDCLVALTVHV